MKTKIEDLNWDEKCLSVINTYGVLPQLKYIQSEIFELNEAIIKFENGVGDIKEIIEELADVEFMLDQFQFYYEINDLEVWEIKHFKADRQLHKIEDEKKKEKELKKD